MSEEIEKAHQIAGQVAITELLRVLIAQHCEGSDETTSKANLARLEELAVNGITARRHFQEVNEQTDTYVKEAAAAFVSRLVSSIRLGSG